MKRIEVIPIAEKKAKQRNIPIEWIVETLKAPLQVVEGYGDRKIAHMKYCIESKEYLLRVVFEENEEAYIVVTAYLTSQCERYWRK